MFDHGILNVPLSKRGDIDAQIDRYKADVQRDERKAGAERRAKLAVDREEAKRMVAACPEARLQELMTKYRTSRGLLISKLNSIAHWTPQAILRGI